MNVKHVLIAYILINVCLVFLSGCDPNQPLFPESETTPSVAPTGTIESPPDAEEEDASSSIEPTEFSPKPKEPTAPIVEPTSKKVLPTNTPEPDTNLDVKAIGYDDYWKFNSLLVSHAMKKIGNYNIRNTGEYKASFSLKRNANYGLFAWCFSKEAKLHDVLSKLTYSVWINGQEIDTRNFEWLFNRDTHDNYCAVPGALVTNIDEGDYHIIIQETINERFDDGIGPYEVGDYIFDLSVTFE